MSNPIETISTYLQKYLWPTEAQPEIKPEVKPEVKKTDIKIQAAKPVNWGAEPEWASDIRNGTNVPD